MKAQIKFVKELLPGDIICYEPITLSNGVRIRSELFAWLVISICRDPVGLEYNKIKVIKNGIVTDVYYKANDLFGVVVNEACNFSI
jgi:hypothetical protein